MNATALDLRNRTALFGALEADQFDVLVIGAGITGCGIARDAALRGLRVALVDARDIAAGTSSRSSKLVHGGMRYLAQGDLTVVREAASERRTLRRIAPHLALTMPLVVPSHTRSNFAALKTGMWTYEKLGGVDPGERHEVWDVERLRAEEPLLRCDGCVGAIVYPEYLTEDARLTIANARSAAGAGAVVVNYAAVTSLLLEQGQAVGAEVSDTTPGSDARARVRARVVVNAAGPWVDAVRRLEDDAAESKLQLTKGIHVVIGRERLPLTRTIIMTASDKRPIFAVPRGQGVYFGTTDTFYPEAEYWPEITAEDVRYLLDAASGYFAVDPFTFDDVTALWSGVRPLLAQAGKSPSEISRRDEVMDGPAGVLSIAGGKLTAYRRMAERVVDHCEKRIGRTPTPSVTAEEPLPGGDFATVADLQRQLERMGMAPAEAERAARLYGAEAAAVFADGGGPAAEATYAVQCEGAVTLEDYWVRRSARARFDPDGGMTALEPAADTMAELLGWSAEERARQVAACAACREREMATVHTHTGVSK